MIDYIIPSLLIISTINLALMIPGGFVEMRGFSAYSSLVLGLFNTFLTILGLGSLVLAYLFFTNYSGYFITILVGISYMIVYLIDLFKVFPKSPKPMSKLLASLESLGTLLGFILIAVTAYIWRNVSDQSSTHVSLSSLTIILISFAGLIIIAFSTYAAIHKNKI